MRGVTEEEKKLGSVTENKNFDIISDGSGHNCGIYSGGYDFSCCGEHRI